MFNNTRFPYMNTQQLNLDWLLKKIKEVLKFMPIDTGNVGDVLQRKETGAEWEPLGAVSLDINGLQTAAIADDDELPIYDKSATGNRKATVAAIRAGVSSPVTSVNGQTGAVVLGKSDVGLGNVDNVKQYSADNPPPYPVTSVNGQTGAVVIPTGGGGAVDSVNGMTGAVVLGKSDVGLANVDNVKQYSADNPPPYPVTSVNGQTGAVTIPTGGSIDMLFGTPVSLTVTAPADASLVATTLTGQTAGNGRFLRIGGIVRTQDNQNNGWKVFTITGVTITAPASEILVNNIGLRVDDNNAIYHNDAACRLRITTAGVIQLELLLPYSYEGGTYTNFFIFPVFVPIA